MSQLTAIRLLDADEPAVPLLEAVRDLAEGRFNKATYQVEPDSFRQVPSAPFAYWVSEKLLYIFESLEPYEVDDRVVKVGLQSCDDFRFIRAIWEVPIPKTDLHENGWYTFAKGGASSSYYSNFPLVVSWGYRQPELEAFGEIKGNAARSRQCSDYYFRKGLTWTVYTTADFAPRVLPLGCILSHVGGAAFTKDDLEINALLICSTRVFKFLLSLTLGLADAGRRVYGVGSFSITPFVSAPDNKLYLARSAWYTKRSTDTANQTSHAFYAPALSPGQFGSRNKKATTA